MNLEAEKESEKALDVTKTCASLKFVQGQSFVF